MGSSRSSSVSSSTDSRLEATTAKPPSPGPTGWSPTATGGWQRVTEAILGAPGTLPPATRAAIFHGDDPPELAALLAKVREHAYRITDADVEGLDVDTVIEAALAAALGCALVERARALEAIE